MNIENNLIITLLKLTKEGPALIENVKTEARIPSAAMLKLLEKLQTEGLVYLKNDTVEADSNLRLKLAVKIAASGADVERVSKLLRWQEFEAIAATTLRKNGYTVSNNVRFKHAGRKWEVDVVGCRKPLVICIDCKHWQHAIAPSALRKIVDAQVERTRALADSLPNISLKLECAKWSSAKFVPAILSLFPSSAKFYDAVPTVPILQLQDFVNQLPAYAGSLHSFHRNFNSLSHNL